MTALSGPKAGLKQRGSIEQRTSFDFIRYANCWEDADVLIGAMSGHNQLRYLSIASAGDNTLALLTLDPALVVAVDLSPVQLSCLEIRMAAFAQLEYQDFLSFLGFRMFDGDREEVYRSLRPLLSPSALRFWDTRVESVRNGIIHDGKFEHYLRVFGRRILPFIHSRETIEEVLQEKNLEERVAFYDSRWNTWPWRVIFKLFFSRQILGRSGRDPEFLRYVDGSVAERILERAKYGLTQISTHDNPYLEYILTGKLQRSLPFYAREENFEIIKKNLGKLRLFHGTTDEALDTFGIPFDGFNLSDIFEYMDDELFRRVACRLLEHAHQGARIAYWNLLAPRRIATQYPEMVRTVQPLSDNLFRKDKAFFYQAFYLDEVVK